MKKIIVFLLFLVIISDSVFSQDFIVKISGDTLKTKILKLNNNDVLYLNYNDLKGRAHKIVNTEILKILKSDGTTISYNEDYLKIDSLLIRKIDQAIELKLEVKLKFKNGFSRQAIINQRNVDNTISSELNFETINYKIYDISDIEFINYPKFGSIGLGLGIPFGILGANLEINPLEYLSLSAGFGTSIYAGMAYNAGGFVYFRKRQFSWQPRISAFYGINSTIYCEGNNYIDEIKESFSGTTVGVGQKYMFGNKKRFGFSLDVMMILDNSEFKNRIEELERQGWQFEDTYNGNVKLSLGFVMNF